MFEEVKGEYEAVQDGTATVFSGGTDKMVKSFEDEFMKVQSEYIALCLEVAEKKIDKVYAYLSIESKSKMFNAFFNIEGEILTLNQVGVSNKLIIEFLKMGTFDLEKIKSICNDYNMPVPTEIKMYYDVNIGKYNANYKYNEVCSSKTGINSGQVFLDWIKEIKNENV